MAKKIVWTETAWNDLENVADFISLDSPFYAAAWVREVRGAARSLSRFAMRGRVVREIGDTRIREVMVQSYRLIYRLEKSRIAILGIVHGARDLRTLWEQRSKD